MMYQTNCEKCNLTITASTEKSLDAAMEKHEKTKKHHNNTEIDENYFRPSVGPRPMSRRSA